ncbi:hypothetical protein CN154_15045 [Sinorhizobium meliloti]|uniref:hypothetical protein n=1 Tax=Rhizobium meliloti TaxID=382 RepID=UPI000FDAA414|nr:hypothetical protein [Sinorhizobium meliloti]RVK75467.1 hypothetical protein CN154_15045 [Sinorhizobium meliloti]
MRKTLPAFVPAPAMMLLDFIGSIEAPRGYGTIYGNNQDKLPLPITDMTLGDVVEAQASWTKRFKSSAAGRYQFMRATLIGIAQEIPSLRGDVAFDKDLQDKLGYYLLIRRGYDKFIAGDVSIGAFGKALAQEWASFPVLAPCAGAHRTVRRGQSYYAGDGLNKSLVKPERVEAILRQVLAAADAEPLTPLPKPSPVAPAPLPAAAAKPSLWGVLAQLLAKLFGARA